jgi:hypothetical protein
MTDHRGQLNTSPMHVETPQIDAPSESPQSLPDPWDVQSNTLPSELASQPHQAPDPNSPESIYIDAKLKLSEAGLLIGKGYTRLAKFESELKGGRLYPIADCVVLHWGEMPMGMAKDLVTDYLWCERDDDVWYACIKDSEGALQLTAL